MLTLEGQTCSLGESGTSLVKALLSEKRTAPVCTQSARDVLSKSLSFTRGVSDSIECLDLLSIFPALLCDAAGRAAPCDALGVVRTTGFPPGDVLGVGYDR